MKDSNNILKFSDNKGITLVALIVIISVMIIIASVSISTGLDSLNSTMLEGFYTQLELVQKRIDDIATTDETYIDAKGNTIKLKQTGEDLTSEQKQSLNNILIAEDFSDEEVANMIDNFKYFTIPDVENILDVKQIDYNLFINFENRIVVAENGIKIENDVYYMLNNAKKFIVQYEDKNVGTIESLIYGDPVKYGTDIYKVTIKPGNTVGDLSEKGYIRYKKASTKYWETTNENYIIMELDMSYNIIFTDLNKNRIERTIIVEYKKDEQGNFIKDQDGNNILIINEK